ncbi:hypothetical protein DWUX_257 [Desulfovibrio diazotrophicus]|nr:hypothetical protein DWUX_257 [Desulfovibrio diazotrophicus]
MRKESAAWAWRRLQKSGALADAAAVCAVCLAVLRQRPHEDSVAAVG